MRPASVLFISIVDYLTKANVGILNRLSISLYYVLSFCFLYANIRTMHFFSSLTCLSQRIDDVL